MSSGRVIYGPFMLFRCMRSMFPFGGGGGGVGHVQAEHELHRQTSMHSVLEVFCKSDQLVNRNLKKVASHPPSDLL